MNFVEGEIRKEPSGYAFSRGEFRLNLDPAVGRAHAGRPVIIGLRPEDVGVTGDPEGAFAGRAVLVSPLGSEQHINVQTGDVELIVRAPKDARIAVGDQLSMAVDPHHVHLFDPSTEMVMKSAS
jgi:multiple sugar transport system ATP-binding protein